MASVSRVRRTVKRIVRRALKWHCPWLTIVLYYSDGSRTETLYRVEERPSDLGRSFDVIRLIGPEEVGDGDGLGMQTYCVALAVAGQQTCGCRAMAYRQTCKHSEAVRKLIDTGRIAGGYPGGEPEVSEEGSDETSFHDR